MIDFNCFKYLATDASSKSKINAVVDLANATTVTAIADTLATMKL